MSRSINESGWVGSLLREIRNLGKSSLQTPAAFQHMQGQMLSIQQQPYRLGIGKVTLGVPVHDLIQQEIGPDRLVFLVLPEADLGHPIVTGNHQELPGGYLACPSISFTKLNVFPGFARKARRQVTKWIDLHDRNLFF